MSEQTSIYWPDYYHPRNARIHVKSQVISDNSPEVIWRCLVNAACWPGWKHSRTSVQIIHGDGHSLERGTAFLWKAGWLAYNCTVVEYQPLQRIAWKGRLGSTEMYHAWVIEPLEQGSRVITEATQRGGMTWLTRLYQPARMQAYHQKWLQCLTEQTSCRSK